MENKAGSKDGATRSNRKRYIIAAGVVILAAGYPLLRQYLSGCICASKARMDGKTVIITGANSGIGKETVRDLMLRGARVLMACRDRQRCQRAVEDIHQTTGIKPVVKLLDLADLDSVRAFVADIYQTEQRLDVLINNAGTLSYERQVSKQGFELHFATNHLGHFLLTNLLLDLLKTSAPSRVLVVTSRAYQRGATAINFDDINRQNWYNPFTAYCQSKLANILFVNELAKKLNGTGVVVNSLHPGVIRTELLRDLGELVPNSLASIMGHLYNGFAHAFLKSEVEGAQTSICLAVSQEVEGMTGKYFSDCEEEDLWPQAMDEDAAARLWRLSEDMSGLNAMNTSG